LFPQPGLKFLANRNNPDAFEPVPRLVVEEAASSQAAGAPVSGSSEVYTVEVQGQAYVVRVTPGGDIESATPIAPPQAQASAPVAPAAASTGIAAPLAGNVFKVLVNPGDVVVSGDVVVVLEAMKMETEIRASSGGTVSQVLAREGDAVAVGATLVTLN